MAHRVCMCRVSEIYRSMILGYVLNNSGFFRYKATIVFLSRYNFMKQRICIF